MKILSPRFTEFLQIIQVTDGFIVREKSDDRVPKNASNLYKVDKDFNFSWEIITRNQGDGFPNPVVIEGPNLKAYSWNCVEIVFNPKTGKFIDFDTVTYGVLSGGEKAAIS